MLYPYMFNFYYYMGVWVTAIEWHRWWVHGATMHGSETCFHRVYWALRISDKSVRLISCSLDPSHLGIGVTALGDLSWKKKSEVAGLCPGAWTESIWTGKKQAVTNWTSKKQTVTNWRLWCATRTTHRQGEEPSSHNAIMPDKEGRDKPQTTHVAVYLSTSKQRAPNKLQNPTPSPKPFPLSYRPSTSRTIPVPFAWRSMLRSTQPKFLPSFRPCTRDKRIAMLVFCTYFWILHCFVWS